MKNINGIYVPGLGDDKTYGQDEAIKAWSKRGVNLLYSPIGWTDKNMSFKDKLNLLCNKIDELSEDSGSIALVGSSAGASAVLNAYVRKQDKVRAIVTICGKIQQRQPISPSYLKKNPPFKESLGLLPDALEQLKPNDLKKIMTAYPWHDGVVPIHDAQINGAHHHRINMIGHVSSIATAITIGKRPLIKFILSSKA